MYQRASLLDKLKADIPASIVVFLVAMPLCLGIALASGAPLFSGLIAGVVGGIVVGAASGSALGVSGPAAGLAVIVLTSIAQLGSFQTFLLAVVIAGLLQVALGYARAGVIGYYFPSSVIKGMLAGIGLTIILKQLPHALGYSAGATGGAFQAGAVIVSLVSLAVLVGWELPFVKRHSASVWIQGPLVAVMVGIALNHVFMAAAPLLVLDSSRLVQLPLADGLSELVALFTWPDFTQLGNVAVYTTAVTLAVVASLETLLCVEATDKLDPYKRVTPTDRELKAQGLGNIVSGLLGGLPVTQVIVRSSANIQSGAQSKVSAILHGLLLLVAVVSVPTLLNQIPLATLAAILLVVGYKLARPALFQDMYRLGWFQFAPFAVTVIGILATDLLVGIGLGLAAAVFSILLNNYRNPYFVDEDAGEGVRLTLSENVSFLHRAALMRTLSAIPPGTKVVIDARRSMSVDQDVYEIIRDFEQRARLLDIDLTVRGLDTLRRENDSMQRVHRLIRRDPSSEREGVGAPA